MGVIHTLPKHVSNLIAAGEVIERPASVVKELLENAIDAGAKHITAEIKNGGVTYIRVTDDGMGMEESDARIAFLRHATSKIFDETDLIAIRTLGFRGEALAATAAVSKVDLITKTKGMELGVQVSMDAGEEVDVIEAGCPSGTTIIVRDLFYNVPARMKFLKKDATESGHVESAVVNAALSRPDIAFEFIKDQKSVFRTPGDNRLISAIYATFGSELASSLISIIGSFGEITLEGYISPPSLSRSNKNMQFFFINGRCIRSRLLSAALEQGYKNRIMSGRSPICFINMRLNLSAVDVNVHPTKLEVKFSREREVFSALYNSVSLTLDGSITEERPKAAEKPTGEKAEPFKGIEVSNAGGNLTFSESLSKSFANVAQTPKLPYKTKSEVLGADAPAYRQPGGEDRPLDSALGIALKESAPSKPGVMADFDPAYDAAASVKEEAGYTEDISGGEGQNPAFRLLGEAMKTYLIAETEKGLWVIDKHAAHERMVFNELVKSREEPMSQLLITPLEVTLSSQDKGVCIANADLLASVGFEVEDFGTPALVLRAIPAYLSLEDVPYALSDMADKIKYFKGAQDEIFEELLKSISCKAAIRAGDQTSEREMEEFIKQLVRSPDVTHCPHGRPVAVTITRNELEKLFSR